MDAHSQELLALPAVRERLAAEAATAAGRALVAALAPSGDPDEVALRQARTTEALALAQRGVGPPHGVADVRGPAGVAERGGLLEIAELGEVSATCRASVEVARAVVAQEDGAPLLAGVARAVDEPALAQLADRLDRALDGHGGLRDDASPDLAAARRGLERARREAADTLRRTAAGLAQHLQERFLTERGGRPVLAVRASSRGAEPGIVHDRSASGQTLFIEPLAVLEANNRVRELEAAERAEVERVLGLLSRDVAEAATALVAAVDAMAEVDLAMAAGALSRRWQGCAVAVAADVVLEGARHPLLDPARAVPIDLPLVGLRALVVSGPNAGGKTVALKTLGLLAMLHQCGLRPPARRARLPVFDRILVDIGDEQSIERDLSTFSAHVRTLVAILAEAGPRSLVLLDEVAAGTDPAEGAALAQAVLERLVAQGALVLATTHHHELKAWASATPGAANAAVGFDPARLAPTFAIRVGEPGASHALEVAERLDLPEEVIAAARRLAGAERAELEDLLREAAAARVA